MKLSKIFKMVKEEKLGMKQTLFETVLVLTELMELMDMDFFTEILI
jgi:hypothetical protein